MTTILEGDATLILDSVEHDVRMRATIDHEAKEWAGFIESEQDGLGWAFLNARLSSIRMPDGREGHVIATGDDDPDTGIGFKGSGRPPV
ncbi:hypothetical protein ACWGHA_11395 [Streptomyces xanthophaeus]